MAKIIGLLAILFIAVFHGVLFDYFFYGRLLGVSFPLYVSLLLGGVIAANHLFKHKFKPVYWILIAPILFFSMMVAVRASFTLTLLNILATLLMLMLFLQSLTGLKVGNFLFNDYVATILIMPFRFLERGAAFFADLIGARTTLKGHAILYQVVKGIFMALPVLFVFMVLFSSADMVFNKFVSNTLATNFDRESIWRFIIVTVVMFVISGALYFAVGGKPEGEETLQKKDAVKRYSGVLQISIFLGLINALFLVFIIVQMAYLFGGENNISLQGYTYADYARRGFFELIWVAVFSFLIILVCESVVERKGEKHTALFKVMGTVLSAQVIIIMIAAFKRLWLYEDAYGFTELRLYSHVFIVWLGVVFMFLIYKIMRDRRESVLMRNLAVSCGVFLFSLNVLNPDAFIVGQNIARIGRPDTVALDTNYLHWISNDAIPTMVLAFEDGDADVKEALVDVLSSRKKGMNFVSKETGEWQAWHYGRMEAIKALTAVEGKGL